MGYSGTKAVDEAVSKVGGGKFLRLENSGDKALIVFLDEPYARELVYDQATKRYVEPAKDAKGSLRISMNVYDKQSQTVRIFEQGVIWYKHLKGIWEKYGRYKRHVDGAPCDDAKCDKPHRCVDAYYVELKREGAMGDTNTTYTMFPERDPIPSSEREALFGLKRWELKEEVNSEEDEVDQSKSNGASPPETMDAAVATDLVNRLKPMPKSTLDEFLK